MAAALYQAPYTCKQAKRSQTLSDLLKEHSDLFCTDDTADVALSRLFMKLTGQTDVTRHECFHHILGYQVRPIISFF
jgi:hypothetical protein